MTMELEGSNIRDKNDFIKLISSNN